MKIHVHGRGGGEGAAGRSKGARITVALLATVALCLGPAAAASADETAATPTDTTAQALDTSVAGTEDEIVATDTSGGGDGLSEGDVVANSGDEGGVIDDSGDDAAASGDAGANTGETGDGTAVGAVGDASGDDASGDATSAEGTSAGDSSGGSTAEGDAEGTTDGTDGVDGTSTEKKDETPTTAARTVAPATVSVQGNDKGGDGNQGHQGIGICHATSSDSNPYVFIPNVDANSIFKEQGHDQHTKADGTRSDIIPAFYYVKNSNKHGYEYADSGSFYPGKNLDETGIYMLAHECNMPPEPPEPPVVLAVGARDCLDPTSESEVQLKATIGNLTIGKDYSVVLTKLPSTPVGSPYEFTASSENQQISWWVDSAGSYRITATGPGDLSDSADATVTNCPDVPPEVVVPEISLYYDDICAPRIADVQKMAESKLWVELADLVEGDEYEIAGTGPNGYTYNDTITADETEEAEFSITGLLPGFYQFTVTGPEGNSQSSTDSVVATNYCPPEPEEPVIEINPGPCVVPGEGQIETDAPQLLATQGSLTEIYGFNLEPGEWYDVSVSNGMTDVFSDEFQANGNGNLYAAVPIYWPGSYIGTISGQGESEFSISDGFKVSECPPVVPELTVTVLPCPSNDSALPLQAKLQATGLEPGESYAVSVTGPSGFVWNGSLMGTDEGTAETIVSLGANGAYTATLEGSRAGIEFTATKTCAPKVITPPAAAGPALPNTGSADTQPLLWAGLLAMLVAVGLMLQPVRTRRMKR